MLSGQREKGLKMDGQQFDRFAQLVTAARCAAAPLACLPWSSPAPWRQYWLPQSFPPRRSGVKRRSIIIMAAAAVAPPRISAHHRASATSPHPSADLEPMERRAGAIARRRETTSASSSRARASLHAPAPRTAAIRSASTSSVRQTRSMTPACRATAAGAACPSVTTGPDGREQPSSRLHDSASRRQATVKEAAAGVNRRLSPCATISREHGRHTS